jgi:hypothetical protein
MAGGDWTQYHETDEEQEAHDRYIEAQRSKWFAEIIEPSELNAPGEPMMKLFRPRDAAWNGTESGPHVGAIIPALEIRISSSSRFRKWLSSDAKRHEISIAPVFSTQTYKDAIRTTNKFFDEYDADQQQTSLRHHLVHYMTPGDTTIDYSSEDFFTYCKCKPDLQSQFTKGFTPYQLEKWEEMRHFEHGIKVVKGGPASGKTAFLLAAALLMAAGEAEHKQVVIATDTNDLANELARRLYLSREEASLDKLSIIRILPTAVEDAKLKSRYVPDETRPFFQDNTISQWAVENSMADQGRKAQASKLRGDKRFNSNIRSVSLHAAMNREINSNPEEYANLRSELNAVRTNPSDPGTAQRWKLIANSLDKVRAKVLSEADIVVATCDLLLREKINHHLAPALLLKDEDGASQRQKTMCLVACFETLRYLGTYGDTKQKGPFTLTSKGNVPATFGKFPLYTSMQFFEDTGISVISLFEQHRMYNSALVSWISRHYYNNALIDANANKPTPAQVDFCKAFIKEQFDIDNNYAYVVLANTKALKEEGSTSTSNPAMQDFFMEKLIALKKKLDTTPADQLGFDPTTFKVGVISSYLGVINWFQAKISRILDHRFSAHILQTVQGSQKNLVFRLNPNRRLSPFAGEGRDNLVADTRWQHGYIVGVTDESLGSETYGKPSTNAHYMLTSSVTKHVYSQYLFAKDINAAVHVDLDEEATAVCEVCEQTGHTAGNTRCPGYGHGKACFNCGQFGHFYASCPDPKITEAPVFKGTCRRCGEGGHHASDCHLPWCKTCQSTEHAGDSCPRVTCRRCGQLGHKGTSPLCPKTPRCRYCESTEHSSKKCDAKPDLRTLFSQPARDDDLQLPNS